MKMTLRQLMECNGSYQKLCNSNKLPIKTSYWLGKNLKKINRELKDFEDARLDLVQKYGAVDEATKNMTVKPENIEAFKKDFEDILGCEVDLDIKPITLDEIANAELSGTDMANLDGFIVDAL